MLSKLLLVFSIISLSTLNAQSVSLIDEKTQSLKVKLVKLDENPLSVSVVRSGSASAVSIPLDELNEKSRKLVEVYFAGRKESIFKDISFKEVKMLFEHDHQHYNNFTFENFVSKKWEQKTLLRYSLKNRHDGKYLSLDSTDLFGKGWSHVSQFNEDLTLLSGKSGSPLNSKGSFKIDLDKKTIETKNSITGKWDVSLIRLYAGMYIEIYMDEDKIVVITHGLAK